MTILDLDLSAEGNQILDTDTTYTIAGLTFTKINSANDQVAAAIVNGSGLVLQPNAGDFINGTRTLPALTLDLAQVVPDFDLSTPVRVWIYTSTFTSSEYTYNYMALENWTTGAAFLLGRRFYKVPPGDIYHGFKSIYASADLSYISAPSGYGTSNVLMIECPLGMAQAWAYSFTGIWAAGWPAIGIMQPLGTHQMLGSTILDSTGVGLASGWDMLIGAYGAAGFSVTVARIRIDYRI